MIGMQTYQQAWADFSRSDAIDILLFYFRTVFLISQNYFSIRTYFQFFSKLICSFLDFGSTIRIKEDASFRNWTTNVGIVMAH